MTEMKCIIKQERRMEVFLFQSVAYVRQFRGFHDTAFDWISGTPKRYQNGRQFEPLKQDHKACLTQQKKKKDNLGMCWNINTVINENSHSSCERQLASKMFLLVRNSSEKIIV